MFRPLILAIFLYFRMASPYVQHMNTILHRKFPQDFIFWHRFWTFYLKINRFICVNFFGTTQFILQKNTSWRWPNMWPKHVGGYDVYTTIDLRICICICSSCFSYWIISVWSWITYNNNFGTGVQTSSFSYNSFPGLFFPFSTQISSSAFHSHILELVFFLECDRLRVTHR